MKKLLLTLFVWSLISPVFSFMHMRIYVVPDFGGCASKIYLQECGLGGNTYLMSLDGNSINFGDASLLTLCSGVHTLVFSATDGSDTYTFNATINLNGNTSSVSYTAAPTVEPMTCVVNYMASAMCDGSITLNMSGGYQPLTYDWFLNGSAYSGALGSSASNLCPGNYGFSVVDNSPYPCNTGMGMPFIPIDIESVSCIVNTTPVSCTGVCDGTAEIIVMANPLTITSALVAGPDNNMFPNMTTNQCAGNAMGFVTHATGTMAFCPSVITGPTPLEFTDFDIVQPTTVGGTGQITALVTGGTPGYQFNWNGTYTSNNTFSTTEGSYSVNVMDSEGCILTEYYIIFDPLAIVINDIQHQTATPANGAMFYTISGGIPPYQTYLNISGTLTASDYTNLLAGDYIAVIQDNGGNSTSINFSIGNALSISTLPTFEFKLYPNPVRDVLYLSFNTNGVLNYKILTASGQILGQHVSTNNPILLQTNEMESGIYFIECTFQDGSKVTKTFFRE
jgi:hypothetical protein